MPTADGVPRDPSAPVSTSSPGAPRTVVHLLRHGEVHNPGRILYGRLPGYHLSERGRAMAERVAADLDGRDITLLVSSPLERAQETAAPVARVLGLDVRADDRLIEADNVFEGLPVGDGTSALRRPEHWRHLRNPARPSWGEPYVELAERMRAAVMDARAAAEGHEAVCVSHQLPIWIARCRAEGRRYLHDPRRRQCSVASLTSFSFEGERLLGVTYREPAGDLAAGASAQAGA